MELKQASIFGEYKQVGKKINKKNVPKKNKINLELKQKIEILYNMYEQLYEKQNINLLDSRDIIIKENIISYPEERQSEPIDIISLGIYDIDKRIIRMKEVLSV